MKSVFLYAYDKQNLGDDLFIHTICNRYPKVKFYLWSDKENKENFRRVKNLIVVDEKNSRMLRMLKKIRPSLLSRYEYHLKKKSKAVVYIGGSIFMEYESWQGTIDWWTYLTDHFPTLALGCNFGPYKSEEYREGLTKIFEKMTDVCFRDNYSHALFPSMPTVRKAPDILFSYPIPKVEVEEKTLFVSPINCLMRGEGAHVSLTDYNDSYLDNLSDLLKEYLADGYTITLSSFSKKEGDEEAIASLREKMGVPDTDSRVKNLFYDGTNEQDLLSALARAEGVVATRFHASILAIAAQRPVLPIVYSDKTLHVLEDIGFSGRVLDLRRGDKITFEEAQTNFVALKLPDNHQLAKDAEGHFAKLDEMLL